MHSDGSTKCAAQMNLPVSLFGTIRPSKVRDRKRMQTIIFKETYRLRLLHYETMLSRARIVGAMMGVAVIYVSSGRIGTDVILASVLSLLCVAAITLVRSYGGYQTLADVIRTLIESGHIYAEEAVRLEVNHKVFLQKNKDAALNYDITMYSVILATSLILFELWSPIALGRDFIQFLMLHPPPME